MKRNLYSNLLAKCTLNEKIGFEQACQNTCCEIISVKKEYPFSILCTKNGQ